MVCHVVQFLLAAPCFVGRALELDARYRTQTDDKKRGRNRSKDCVKPVQAFIDCYRRKVIPDKTVRPRKLLQDYKQGTDCRGNGQENIVFV